MINVRLEILNWFLVSKNRQMPEEPSINRVAFIY